MGKEKTAKEKQLDIINLRRGKIIHQTTNLESKMDSLIQEYFIVKDRRLEFLHSFLSKESISFSFKHEICGFIASYVDKEYFDKVKDKFHAWMGEIKDLRNDAAHRIFWGEYIEMGNHEVYLTRRTTDKNKIKIREISFTAVKMKRHLSNCVGAGIILEVIKTKIRSTEIKKSKASEA